MMFADVKRSEKYSEADPGFEIQEFLKKFIERITDAGDFVKADHDGGDNCVLFSYDPVAIAHAALQLEYSFKHHRWRHQTLRENRPEIRISAHAEKVTIRKSKDGKLIFQGINIIRTARLEPVATAGEVWITSSLKNLVESEDEFRFIDIGYKELSKGSGILEIFQLVYKGDHWHQEIKKISPKFDPTAVYGIRGF